MVYDICCNSWNFILDVALTFSSHPVSQFLNFVCLQHCAGINCLAVLNPSTPDGCEYLFTGSRDGTLKRWALTDDAATCSTTFESHVDWVGISYNCLLTHCLDLSISASFFLPFFFFVEVSGKVGVCVLLV